MENQTQTEQITAINNKLDLILNYVEQQRLKTQQLEDLVSDITIVGNDIFKSTVEELEHNSIELDTDELRLLVVRLIKNIKNINNVVAMFQSVNDLIVDLGPILRGMSFDLIAKIEEYEQKGYFEIFENLNKNSDKIFNTIKLLTQPSVLSTIESIAKVSTSIKMDDNIDNKSFFKLYKEFKKPEVRKTLSYSLRMIQEINKEIKN